MLIGWFLGCLLFQDTGASLRVDYVVLDVLARDAAGLPVTDLTLADFEVRDGRKKIKPAYFEKLDFRAPAAEEADSAVTVADPIQQTLILVLDLGRLSVEQMTETLDDVAVFLELQRKRTDLQMFVFSLDLGVVSGSFTNDATRVIDDLTLFQGRMETFIREQPPHDPSFADFEIELNKCLGAGGGAPGQLNQPYTTSDMGGLAPCLENTYRVFTEAQTQRARFRMSVLGRFFHFLAGVDGLKSVYLVSPGWAYEVTGPAGDLTRAYLNLRKNANVFAAGDTGAVGADFAGVEDEVPFSAAHFQLQLTGPSLEDDYLALQHAAFQNRIVLHAFQVGADASGRGKAALGVPSAGGIDSGRMYHRYDAELGRGIGDPAERTGGTFAHAYDMTDALTRVAEGHRFYYVLGYPRPDVRKGRFRKLNVTCRRPGVELVYRRGYFAGAR